MSRKSNEVIGTDRLPAFGTILFVLLGITLSLSPAVGQEKKADAAQLTQEFLALHHQFQNSNAAARAALAPGIAKKVAERQQALAELIEENPGEVLRLAIPAAVRGDLPEEIQLMMEDEADLEGTLEVLYECSQESSRLRFGLETAAGRHALHFAKEPPEDLLTGTLVRVHGVRLGKSLALESGSSSVTVQALAATLANTFGEQKTAVILVNFTDNAAQPYTLDYARNVVFNTTSAFDMENSQNKTWLTGDVFGWYRIAVSGTVCDSTAIATQAKQAAAAAGVDLSRYTRLVYGFPDNACAWWGLGSIGGSPSQAWINGSFTLKVVGHEMGHNLGLNHSRTATAEYGDTLDIMGNPSSGHFNAFQKERLGWLNYGSQPPITTVQASGDYFIDPYAASGSNPKALKILKSVDASGYKTWYYVEHRTGIGFDSSFASNTNVMNGAVVHTGSESTGNSSYLLDMTPATATFSDPALVTGSSFTDSAAGVTITTISASNTGATVNVNLGTQSCAPASPSLTITSAQSQWGAPGSMLSFALTLKNNDSSACGSTTFNLGTAPPAGWVAVASPSPLTLAPGASASVTVQVTSPSSAASALYDTQVTATSTADSGKKASATVTYGVSNPACIPGTPGLAATPALSQVLPAGSSASFTLTLTNNDCTACSSTTFNLKATPPAGWTVTFSSSSVTVAPGTTATVSMTVKSPNTAADGTYEISVTATSITDASKTVSAPVKYSISTTVSSSVSTSKDSYAVNEKVVATATVMADGAPRSGASVAFTVKKANGATVSQTLTTGTSGTAVYNLQLSRKDPTGAYEVSIVATANGKNASSAKAFTVTVASNNKR